MRQYPHGGDIYSGKYRVDFSVNVNPLGAPESVKEAVRKSAESIGQYPDALCRDLTRALAEKEHLAEENILFGNGAAELIFALTQALGPKQALIAAPGFAEYEAALSASGCFIRRYPLRKENGFLLQEDFCNDLTDELNLVFLCNPNNPTGLAIPQELLLKILDRCRELYRISAGAGKSDDAGKIGRLSESADSARFYENLCHAGSAPWLSSWQR